MKLSDILSAINVLQVRDLEAIRDAVNAKLDSARRTAPTAQSQLTPDEMMVLDLIASKCRNMGVDIMGSGKLRLAPNFHEFASKVPALMQWALEGSGRRLTKNELRNLLSVGIECLYEDMQDWRGVNARALMDNIHKIPMAIDKGTAYPGYSRCRMLHMIVATNKVGRDA
jgi:hypothetical protein